MPVTFRQSLLFTLITASLMVYCMSLYNTLRHYVVWDSGMLIPDAGNYGGELAVAFPLAFVAGRKIAPVVAKFFSKKAVPVGMVCLMAPAMTLFVSLRLYGSEKFCVSAYFESVVLNMAAALPVQILIAGPVARFLFRKMTSPNLFCRGFFSLRGK